MRTPTDRNYKKETNLGAETITEVKTAVEQFDSRFQQAEESERTA